MANCHVIFTEFDKVITLSKSKRDSLNGSRKSLRDEIRTYIIENRTGYPRPKFYSQGSFAMRTAVNPIPIDEKLPYDLDDGIYFDQPREERLSPQAYHDAIVEAVRGHTGQDPADKNTCVRVLFSDGHHVDLPIYWTDSRLARCVPELAHKRDGWVVSDPKALVEWFKTKQSAQLKRIVKYGKAWLDYQNQDQGKMPSGLIVTILATDHFLPNDRDDVCLRDTFGAILRLIETQGFECHRPTPDTSQNLFDKYSAEQKEQFKGRLSEIVKDGTKAIENPNQRTACEKWQDHFGERFSCHEAKDELEDAKRYESPAVLRSPAKSA